LPLKAAPDGLLAHKIAPVALFALGALVPRPLPQGEGKISSQTYKRIKLPSPASGRRVGDEGGQYNRYSCIEPQKSILEPYFERETKMQKSKTLISRFL
jgi:hypothetical protein